MCPELLVTKLQSYFGGVHCFFSLSQTAQKWPLFRAVEEMHCLNVCTFFKDRHVLQADMIKSIDLEPGIHIHFPRLAGSKGTDSKSM